MATEFQTPPQAQIPGRARPRPQAGSRRRIILLLFGSFLLMIAGAGIAFSFAIHSCEEALRFDIERNLTEKARMFAADVNSDRTRSIAILTAQEGQLAGARATVIDTNAKVIADSEVRVSELEDEGRDPEFASALRGETGTDVRARGQFGVNVLYVAVPVSGGAVRLAYPLADLEIQSSRSYRTLAAGCAIAIALALFISAVASAAISRS
jgi:two-component system, OmpR family, phosphate regulon sensor histidine kinase PhoR